MLRTVAICIVSIFSLSLGAQSGINAVGGDVSGTVGSVSFSIGQTFYAHYNDSSALINEGVQQPVVDTSTASNVALQSHPVLTAVFPNPFQEELNLVLLNAGAFKIEYRIFDSGGRVVAAGELYQPEIRISTRDLTSGYYTLVLLREGLRLKTFKLSKL